MCIRDRASVVYWARTLVDVSTSPRTAARSVRARSVATSRVPVVCAVVDTRASFHAAKARRSDKGPPASEARMPRVPADSRGGVRCAPDSTGSDGRGLQADRHAPQRLAHRAGLLCLLGHPGERLRVQAPGVAADAQADPRDVEAAGRVRAERHIGGDIERARRTARLLEERGQLHRVAGRERGPDQLLRTGGAVGIISGTLGEGHVERGEPGADELDVSAALGQGPGPSGACGAGWHGASLSVWTARRYPRPCPRASGGG